jgi:CheY-like chemotaxis protein
VSLQGDSPDEPVRDAHRPPVDPARRTRVTVIDDAPDFLALVADVLEGTYEVTTSTGEDLDLEGLVRFDPDLIVLDLRLRDVGEQLTGMELLRLIRAHRILRTVPIVVCSADIAQLTRNRDALARVPRCWVLPKPFSLDEFERMLAEALRADDTEQGSQPA